MKHREEEYQEKAENRTIDLALKRIGELNGRFYTIKDDIKSIIGLLDGDFNTKDDLVNGVSAPPQGIMNELHSWIDGYASNLADLETIAIRLSQLSGIELRSQQPVQKSQSR